MPDDLIWSEWRSPPAATRSQIHCTSYESICQCVNLAIRFGRHSSERKSGFHTLGWLESLSAMWNTCFVTTIRKAIKCGYRRKIDEFSGLDDCDVFDCRLRPPASSTARGDAASQ